MNLEDFIKNYFNETAEIVKNIDPVQVNKAIDILHNAWENGNTVFVMGNGGSAATATHFTCDLLKPTHNPGEERFKAICLNDNVPVMSAWVNDVGWDHLYVGQLENFMKKGDVLVGFSVHGGSVGDENNRWSANMPKAIKYAKEKGAKTIGFAGFDGGAMKLHCDACVVIPVESTPHVEGLHMVLHHAIISALKKKMNVIEEHK
ncbi:MAG: Phosphoheptose isomerase [Candidatus Woesearchaeota archaeon]|nr:Phosphoheptose isomerase [Candidatus Woesearchaeota archaeon]